MTTVTDAEAIVQAIIGTPGTVLSQASYDALVNGIKAYRQAAILEGMEIMREAAVQWAKDDAKLCDCFARSEGECVCGAWCDWKTVPMERVAQNLAELDPAAIIAQHKRTKAMDNAVDAGLI
jgi:hypothetical protein